VYSSMNSSHSAVSIFLEHDFKLRSKSRVELSVDGDLRLIEATLITLLSQHLPTSLAHGADGLRLGQLSFKASWVAKRSMRPLADVGS